MTTAWKCVGNRKAKYSPLSIFLATHLDMPRGPSLYTTPIRRNITLPGILADTIRLRREEFGYLTFSPFALEMICFDLRKRREHLITATFARDTRKVQEAFNRLLYRHYRPGHERRGVLIQAIDGKQLAPARKLPRGDFASFRAHVEYSEALAPCIEIRWKELGYPSFAAYVLGLIRYDFMLLGPHAYFNGDDTDAAILESLDHETKREFHSHERSQSLYVDYRVNLAAGRRLPDNERDAELLRLAAKLKEWAIGAGT